VVTVIRPVALVTAGIPLTLVILLPFHPGRIPVPRLRPGTVGH
jgi:hypothetical protein